MSGLDLEPFFHAQPMNKNGDDTPYTSVYTKDSVLHLKDMDVLNVRTNADLLVIELGAIVRGQVEGVGTQAQYLMIGSTTQIWGEISGFKYVSYFTEASH